MSNPVLDLSNTSNWVQFYQEHFTALVDDPVSDYPFVIGNILVPILIDSPIIAVTVSPIRGKDTWKQAGFARRKISIGLAQGGSTDAYLPGRILISLRSPTLLIFEKYSTSYALEFRPFDWIQEMIFTIHEYIGTQSDTTEDVLNQIKTVDLPRIEGKIDSINQALGD